MRYRDTDTVSGGFRYVANFDSQANPPGYPTAGQTAVYTVTQQHASPCGVDPNYQVSAPKLFNGSTCLDVFEDPRPHIGEVRQHRGTLYYWAMGE